MKRFHPLPDTHPELSVLDDVAWREYRVENWRLARDGSGKIVRGTSYFNPGDVILLAVVTALRSWVPIPWVKFVTGGVCALLLWLKCTQVLHESVIIIPRQGIQFETAWGLPSFTLFSARRFVRAEVLRDVVINEALRRWNVRFYLVAIQSVGQDNFKLDVAFENLLPHNVVLRQVYHGVHNMLLNQN